jgi:hypothetical protein
MRKVSTPNIIDAAKSHLSSQSGRRYDLAQHAQVAYSLAICMIMLMACTQLSEKTVPIDRTKAISVAKDVCDARYETRKNTPDVLFVAFNQSNGHWLVQLTNGSWRVSGSDTPTEFCEVVLDGVTGAEVVTAERQ